MRARRAALAVDDAAEAARVAAQRLAETPDFAQALRIAAYWPLPHELSTQPLFERVSRAGKTLLLPRLDEARGVLAFVRYVPGDELRRRRYGLLEPAADSVVDLGASDLVVVPGLAFDAAGHRLGAGGGWYDRTFGRAAERRATTLVGFAFHVQIVEHVPAGPQDRGVDAIVTERGVLYAAGGAGRTG